MSQPDKDATRLALSGLLIQLTYAVQRAKGKTTITETDLKVLRDALALLSK